MSEQSLIDKIEAAKRAFELATGRKPVAIQLGKNVMRALELEMEKVATFENTDPGQESILGMRIIRSENLDEFGFHTDTRRKL